MLILLLAYFTKLFFATVFLVAAAFGVLSLIDMAFSIYYELNPPKRNRLTRRVLPRQRGSRCNGAE